eukprot:304650-Hanusia_phi.AAC.1
MAQKERRKEDSEVVTSWRKENSETETSALEDKSTGESQAAQVAREGRRERGSWFVVLSGPSNGCQRRERNGALDRGARRRVAVFYLHDPVLPS